MNTPPDRDACPTPPPKPDPGALGFAPFQKMVRWFSPSELVRAGVKAVLSDLFGSYADNRELQAVRSDIRTEDYGDRDEMWIDYVADLGDGWDSTYAIARLLAEPTLAFGGTSTERGNILVMGGDQVYPTATREEYRNRLAGPYRAALPCVLPERDAPQLYAVPGNHDWYDGLTSFTRLFCQERWIGGWKTRQSRSYFALQLPHDWWLWGIDVQLGSDIDLPQLDFFRRLGASIDPGAKIILCTAEPTWVYTDREGVACYDNLALFEREAITKHGHEHVVGLAGDLHTYARYEQVDGRQRFISGGGGAYLYPSHQLPEELHLPTEPGPKEERETEPFELGQPETPEGEALFPSRRASRRLAWRCLLLPFKNFSFALLLGAFYLFLTWLVQSAGKALDLSFLDTLAGASPRGSGGFLDGVSDLIRILAHAPLALLTVLVLGAGLIGFADAKGVRKVALGCVHTLGHLAALLGLTWAFARLNVSGLGMEVDTAPQVLLFAAEMLGLGSIVAGMVMGLYLYLAHRLLGGAHANEVFSCQSRPDYKHFLRLHIDREGQLTIYPIGLRDVPRRWRYRPEAGPGEAWFEPEGQPLEEQAALLEPPIRVRRERPTDHTPAPAATQTRRS